MPPVELEMDPPAPESSNDQSKTLSGPVVGIIYPPPEVRNIVDKTASFVARNGPEFEARIRQNELGNPKFNFLSPGDPYHAYYQHKVVEFRDGKGNDPTSGLPAGIQKLSMAHQKQQELLKQVAEQQFIPKEPPPEFEFIADPPSISALDLDIVKMTAQFVARNGRQFLTNLMNREQRNYQFDFLRPQHSLFQYFTKLLEQYTKILIPPKDLMNKLKVDTPETGRSHMNSLLENVKYRANYFKYQDNQRRREEDKLERERVAYAQIDWHDFVVVEVVDYQPYESGSFPPPTTPEEVGARVLMEERFQEDDGDIEMQIESDDEGEPTGRMPLARMEDRTKFTMSRDNNQVQDMDEASSDEEDVAKRNAPGKMQPPVAPLLPPTHDKVIVKKYDPKQAAASKSQVAPKTGDDFLISPITGEKIPASKMTEHMRIGLLDPRWVEQRDKHTVEKMAQDTVYAAGTAIEASLKQLAERRTDIFGVGDEETVIGKKLGEEEPKKDDRVTWDGHTSSLEAATRAARANITLEDQIHQIHKVKGLLPDEEKEKIGPKPVQGGGHHQHHHHHHHHHQQQQQHHHHQHHQEQQQRAAAAAASLAAVQNQAQIVVPPKPPQQVVHHHQAPPQQPQHPPQGMPPMMMMPMRPPPMMPPFQVPFMPQMGGPPGGMAPPPLMDPGFAPPPEMGQPPMDDDQPPNKKSRTEDHLLPEAEFMARNGSGPVTIHVQVPHNTEKPEWRLNGQMVSVTMQPTDTVTAVKAKIQEETGMPPAKQKVSHEGMFFKDSNSLAYYNLRSGAVIQLALKERGGRKK